MWPTLLPLLFPLILGPLPFLLVWPLIRRARLVRSGTPVPATVLSNADTGVTVNGQPQAKLGLRVEPPLGAPYQVVARVLVPRLNPALVAPGARVVARFDPGRPDRVAVDLASSVEADGTLRLGTPPSTGGLWFALVVSAMGLFAGPAIYLMTASGQHAVGTLFAPAVHGQLRLRRPAGELTIAPGDCAFELVGTAGELLLLRPSPGELSPGWTNVAITRPPGQLDWMLILNEPRGPDRVHGSACAQLSVDLPEFGTPAVHGTVKVDCAAGAGQLTGSLIIDRCVDFAALVSHRRR